METVITRCWCAWVVVSNSRKYPPTDGFGDVSWTVCSRAPSLDYDLLSLSFMTIDIVYLCIHFLPFTNHFGAISEARWQFTRRGDDVCVNKCQFFCVRGGGLPYLSALMNWLSCLITMRITHIFRIQSAKPGKVALGKSVLQFFNWCINQMEGGNVLCLCSGTFLDFE